MTGYTACVYTRRTLYFYGKGVCKSGMQRYMRTRPSRSLGAGFTIVELAVVIIVLAILLSIATISVAGYQEHARDSQRQSDTSSIATELERYYRTNAVATGATYPDSSTTTQAFTAIIDDFDAVTAPDQTTVGVVMATSSGAQLPTISQYIYQPLNMDDTLCSAAPCVRYKIYYRTENTDEVVVVNSMRQQ